MCKQITRPTPLILLLTIIAFCSSYYISYAAPSSFSMTSHSEKRDSTDHIQIGPFILEHRAAEDSHTSLPLKTHKNFDTVASYLKEFTNELDSYGLRLPSTNVLLVDRTNINWDAYTDASHKEIVIYENDMDVRQVVAHEVGHIVDNLLMNHDKWKQYQQLRPFPSSDMYFEERLAWADRPCEMFADDFASLFTGYSRFSETPPQYLALKNFMVDLIRDKNEQA